MSSFYALVSLVEFKVPPLCYNCGHTPIWHNTPVDDIPNLCTQEECGCLKYELKEKN